MKIKSTESTSWEERFSQFVVANPSSPTGHWWSVPVNGIGVDATPDTVKAFIAQEIATARQEEREKTQKWECPNCHEVTEMVNVSVKYKSSNSTASKEDQ